MSGTVTITPGYEFPADSTAITKARLNLLANPTAQVAAGAITARELSSSILPVDPTVQAIIYDDFLMSGGVSNTIGAYPWKTVASGTSTGVTVGTSTAANPGIITFARGQTNNGYSFLRGASGSGCAVKGGGAITITWLIKGPDYLSDVTDNYELYIGLGNGAANGSEPTDGVYFFYNYATSSGVWVGKTAAGSSRTSVVSATTVALNTWYTLKAVINAAGTSVEFFVNGVSAGTSTTNLPTAALTPLCGVFATTGTARGISFSADYVKLVQDLTITR